MDASVPILMRHLIPEIDDRRMYVLLRRSIATNAGTDVLRTVLLCRSIAMENAPDAPRAGIGESIAVREDEAGRLVLRVRIGPAIWRDREILLEEDIPETVAIAMEGEPADAFLAHPACTDRIIEIVERTTSGTRIRLSERDVMLEGLSDRTARLQAGIHGIVDRIRDNEHTVMHTLIGSGAAVLVAGAIWTTGRLIDLALHHLR